jgi:hypothetical protein
MSHLPSHFLHINQHTLSQFNDIHAIATKNYGPYWFTFFSMITGQYPVTVDPHNPEHTLVVESFVNLLTGLQYTLPCQFCRASFKQFLIELPINRFTNSRLNMMLWLYLIKDKVNTKLIAQEKEYQDSLLQQLAKSQITRQEYLKSTQSCFKTSPTSPFEDVLQYYNKLSATCSKEIKKCISNNYSLKF